MPQEGFKRKLAAILSADVVGYSRLMRDDEEATVRDLASHRVLITEIMQQHNGRVVDSPGDNILAEFASVVDAVNGAIKIQQEIKKSNNDTRENRRMEFRIGINLGDVIEEEERLYGDGVNIAARVEELAAGGGIAISGTVYEHIKEKLSLGYHYLGEQDVKNISEPVRVYRLLTEPEDAGKMIGEKKPKSRNWGPTASIVLILIVVVTGALVIWNHYFRSSFEPASVEKMAYQLPDKPSIAVLPFKNISGDSEQEFLADGITESIIGAISRVSGLFVIASNSVFTYKGKAVKIQTVSEELGVQNILEGTVQRDGNRLRISSQLIDAITGRHLWSEKYDRNMGDIFSVQDNISKEVLTALQVKLVEGEQARVWAKGTSNLDAFIKFLQAYEHFRSFTKNNMILTRRGCQEAIALDPSFAVPYGVIGAAHMIDFWMNWGESRADSLKHANAAVQKAITLDPLSDLSYAALGFLFLTQTKFDDAVAAGKKSIELNPNGHLNMVLLGITYNYVRHYEDAIMLFKKAQRLNPDSPAWYIHNAGISYIQLGRWDESIAECKRALKRDPDHVPALYVMASAYGLSGSLDEGRAVVAQILKINPNASMEGAGWGYKYKVDSEKFRDGLREVGLPEK
jgi:adenylate cyclase